MTWNSADIWTTEVSDSVWCFLLASAIAGLTDIAEPDGFVVAAGFNFHVQVTLAAGQRIEYNYVIMEEHVDENEEVRDCGRAIHWHNHS